ncbi:hypothetical protein R3P38DRAFT_3473794 [Favolaschia claudopus]|uniref:F-box domain-containing protein n=1 Tax=Favolaschia claudopus TaxID=2862362 RepID=A0AAW0CFL4_9AGAR
MSVKVVEARIGKVCADIEVQEEVLKQLYRKKSVAQRKLNSLRDPISRLPLELSSQIFLQCLPDDPPKPAAHSVPMLLLNICSAWRDIALSMPDLWTTIYLDRPQIQTLELWGSRARGHALCIHIHITALDLDITAVLARYTKQIKHLSLYQQDGDLNNEDWVLIDCSAILTLLRLAPDIVEFTFDSHVSTFEGDEITSSDRLTLPCLLHLSLGRLDIFEDMNVNQNNTILNHLTLPALQSLCLELGNVTPIDFSSFLRRSSPPLQQLSLLIATRRNPSFLDVMECFRLVPTLVSLDLIIGYYIGSSFLSDFLSTILDSSQYFPNLETLKIKDRRGDASESCHSKYLMVLSARRIKLVSASLSLRMLPLYRSPPKLDPAIDAALQKLAASGMDIYLGTEDENWISVLT